MKHRQANGINEARYIARTAQQKIRNKTGIKMSLMLCPMEHILKTPRQMLYKIAMGLNMSPDCYTMKTRARDVVELRFIGAHFLRMYFPEVTLQQIAALYGGQDHSSVISGLMRAHDLIYTGDTRFMEKYAVAAKTVEQWLKNEVALYSLGATA